jgi:HK97 family phage prohead protease
MNNSAMLDEWTAVCQWRAVHGVMDAGLYVRQKEAAERNPATLMALWHGLYDYTDSGSQLVSVKRHAIGETQRKTIDIRLKSGDGGSETFTFYGAHFGNIDRQNDLLPGPGCIRNCDEFCRDGAILLGHDLAALPIASPVSCVQDGTGMRVTARWHTTQAAQDAKTVVRERMREKRTVACSIGYLVNDEKYENHDGQRVRVLTSIDVYEISLVNLPSNHLATVVSA